MYITQRYLSFLKTIESQIKGRLVAPAGLPCPFCMSRLDIRSIRRRQILDAAERLAAHKGWPETTIADICQAADVSTGVVTRYFKSKDEMMLAALEDMLEQLHAQLEPLLLPEMSLSENMYRHLHVLSRIATSQQPLLQLLLHFIASSISRPEIAERLHAFFSHLRQQHTTDVARMLDEQGMQSKSPALLIDLLHSLALSVTLSRAFLGIDLPPERLAFESSNMLLKYFDFPLVPERGMGENSSDSRIEGG